MVHTDVCGSSLGYTLEQLGLNSKPRGVAAYGSRKQAGSQLNYGIYEGKFLAVVEASKLWKYYLADRHFVLLSYHKSLICLRNQNLIVSVRVLTWLDFLAYFDFDIKYLSDKNNTAADAVEIKSYRMYGVMFEISYMRDVKF